MIVKETAVVPDNRLCVLFFLALRNDEDMKFTQVDTTSDDYNDVVGSRCFTGSYQTAEG